MVEGVDEREGRGAVQGPTIVERGGDVDGRLVHIGDAEIHFPHDDERKADRWSSLACLFSRWIR